MVRSWWASSRLCSAVEPRSKVWDLGFKKLGSLRSQELRDVGVLEDLIVRNITENGTRKLCAIERGREMAGVTC